MSARRISADGAGRLSSCSRVRRKALELRGCCPYIEHFAPRPLPDRHRRIRADPGQPRLDRPDVGPVPGRGQLGQRGPALPARRHPLPLVRAHGAYLRARVGDMVTTGHTDIGPHTRTTARSALKDHFTEPAVVALAGPEPS